MSKTTSKESVARLVKICALKGLKYVVISPGSRNAPLTISFAEDNRFECLNIPDERVAAFFASGMAMKLKQPVILCCTSGSAVLNYAPAISEAYYQKIPLLVLTADRPIGWIDQRAGQTMRQRNVFEQYIKGSFELIEEASQAEHKWYNDRIVNEAINLSTNGGFGPVHINVPLREPLYDMVLSETVDEPKIIATDEPVRTLSVSQLSDLNLEWTSYTGILIIVGQGEIDPEFNTAIQALAMLPHVVVLTETTSNVTASEIFPSIDRLIDSIEKDEYKNFTPDLVISCRAAIVSKKIRFMLRMMKIKAHWHIDPHDSAIDTYQALTRLISVDATYLFQQLSTEIHFKKPTAFKEAWQSRELKTKQLHNQFIAQCKWSDLFVFSEILKKIPSGVLHLASSTPIRYIQLFGARPRINYKCNRGVSGIDGCTSTAAGYAFLSNEVITLITGDIAFFYDSNAFWHPHLSNNLKVILINNEGGNIFRFVKGPDKTAHLEKHFETVHHTTAKGIASSHGLEYLSARNSAELKNALLKLYLPENGKATILEVFTPREENIPILKEYFSFLKK